MTDHGDRLIMLLLATFPFSSEHKKKVTVVETTNHSQNTNFESKPTALDEKAPETSLTEGGEINFPSAPSACFWIHGCCQVYRLSKRP